MVFDHFLCVLKYAVNEGGANNKWSAAESPRFYCCYSCKVLSLPNLAPLGPGDDQKGHDLASFPGSRSSENESLGTRQIRFNENPSHFGISCSLAVHLCNGQQRSSGAIC